MSHVLKRWIVLLVSLLVLGPVAGILVAMLRAPDGGAHASLFINTSPVWGAVVGLLVFALAAAGGVPAARVGGVGHGYFCAGLVLAWAAWATGQIDHILHRTQSVSTMYTLTGEAVFVGAMALGLGVLLLWISKDPSPHGGEAGSSAHPHHVEPRALWNNSTPQALLIGAAIGGIVAWLVAQDTLKGQTFAAAAFAGMLGATAGRMSAPNASAVTFVAAIVVLAVVSPVAATFMHAGGMGPTRAALAGRLFALARPLPLDWAAGAFFGIPLGLSWAASMIDRHAPKADGHPA
ncbi:MAG: hypothetical protein KF699_00010 [Phycisphaeraceae bacterium]|nr:hypothetical protein [Phycisphaeraceae bacterium]MBX3406749.1 hypothetical protein [Phycisphaeraceae bacterium]